VVSVNPATLEQLSKAFTPHRPIDLPEFLSGRLSLLYRGMDAVNTDGLHLILFGDRGTGKTSIAKVLAYMVQEPQRRDGRRVLTASCYSSDTYTTIWRRVFQEVLLAPRQLGFAVDREQLATHRMADFEGTDPNDVRLMVQAFPNPTVIVIDEFDRVPTNTDARRLMADTIKLFSDTGVPATIVLVGVADSIGELISEHQSIARNVAQIPVEPMPTTELADIVRKGYDHANLGYADGLPRQIAELSQGYPHYTHLLALWAGRRALELGQDGVTETHLADAIPAALENATGGVQQEYEMAVASSQKDALFKQVLLACALARKDSLGKFAATDLRGPLRRITGREYLTGAYQSHLAKFCESERGPILKKSGKRRSYRWRFVNPQIIPYVLLRGREDGAIS
jgi:Cdc6-like AAA superfamily ATPase